MIVLKGRASRKVHKPYVKNQCLPIRLKGETVIVERNTSTTDITQDDSYGYPCTWDVIEDSFELLSEFYHD